LEELVCGVTLWFGSVTTHYVAASTGTCPDSDHPWSTREMSRDTEGRIPRRNQMPAQSVSVKAQSRP
jgi:hypothetical protein